MSPSPRRQVPTGYTLRVGGLLDDHWSPWFDNLTLTRDSEGTTSLSGLVSDQAQLYGLLIKIRNLGLTLISLNAINPADTVAHERDPVDDEEAFSEHRP